MAKLITAVLILAQILTASSNAWAGLPPTTIKGQSDTASKTKTNFQVPNSQMTDLGGLTALLETGNRNLLVNPGFEASTATSGWTVSAGTPSADTSVFFEGKKSLSVSLTAVNGDILSQSLTPGSPLSTINLAGGFRVNTTLTTLQACTLAAGVEQQCVPIPSGGTWAWVTPTMIGPSSGTIGIKIKSTSSTTGSFNVDAGYLGPAEGYNLSQISQATLYGTAVITGCASNWSTTSTTFTDPATQTGCVYTTTGNASAPSTNIPAIKFASLPPGEYFLTYDGQWGNLTANDAAYLKFTDGTNDAREQVSAWAGGVTNTSSFTSSIAYTTAQTNVTLKIQMKTDSGGTAQIWGRTAAPGTIKVYRYPTSSETALRIDQTPASWSGYHDSTCTWTSTSSSQSDPAADTTCTFNQRTSNNFGAVTSGGLAAGATGSATPTITFTPTRATRYMVIVSATVRNGGVAGTGAEYTLTDGSNNQLDTWKFDSPGANYDQPLKLIGFLNATSTAAQTVKIRVSSPATATLSINAASKTVEWQVIDIGQSVAMPVIVGTVATTSAGQERLERAYTTNVDCTASPCTLTYNTPGISSITWTSTGNYSVNFAAGTFSAPPVCFMNTIRGDNVHCEANGPATTSAQNFSCILGSTGVAAAARPQVMCMGPK